MSPSDAFLYAFEVPLSGERWPKRALGAGVGWSQGGGVRAFGLNARPIAL